MLVKKAKKTDVVVIGGANAETVVHHAVAFHSGVTIPATRAIRRVGGGALNQAAFLLAFGERRAHAILPIGDDESGRLCKNSLISACGDNTELKEFVDTSTTLEPNLETGESFVVEGHLGGRTILPIAGSVSHKYAASVVPNFRSSLEMLADTGWISVGQLNGTPDDRDVAKNLPCEIFRTAAGFAESKSRAARIYWNLRSSQASYKFCTWKDVIDTLSFVQLTCVNARMAIRESQACDCDFCRKLDLPGRGYPVRSEDVVRVIARFLPCAFAITLGHRGSLSCTRLCLKTAS